MENKKGSGVFLGVVSVATLIVAIIGATFAFFSASAVGDNEVNVTAYNFNASLSVTRIDDAASKGLIPMYESNLADAITTDKVTGNTMCLDENGYAACHVYQLVITNNSETAITLSGEVVTTSDPNPFTLTTGEEPNTVTTSYIKMQELTESEGEYRVGSSTSVALPVAKDGTVAIPNMSSVSVAAAADGVPSTTTLYVIVFIEEPTETETDQSSFMNYTYNGKFVFSTSGGKLTADFSA